MNPKTVRPKTVTMAWHTVGGKSDLRHVTRFYHRGRIKVTGNPGRERRLLSSERRNWLHCVGKRK